MKKIFLRDNDKPISRSVRSECSSCSVLNLRVRKLFINAQKNQHRTAFHPMTSYSFRKFFIPSASRFCPRTVWIMKHIFVAVDFTNINLQISCWHLVNRISRFFVKPLIGWYVTCMCGRAYATALLLS